ncbi:MULTISPECIES: RNA 2',3'-cyclic phosphodiesterase [unclassified Dietzia]|uniref:RNA 2',3'-cyclic phosphodiesterase n=1 Tax=unclassified Dietzia TaxID=2617939 RepID=UPI000D200C9D|nr:MULTISPECIES: RNA 2',3'-cyclic phosphodiesterase [unclassified Dietzia]AVZ38217.1 RNA 2',3'-cyclic phosphodiesterase [Dietzia sp. JS16-p6b]MBB1025798.1 RNA 2',3'-cyclic phosphodiesterase [Dietzia sp. DQ12-76]QGW23202.1 2'-5' RNA ligase [Dietzia sp. DQ12-45-1b]
MGHRMFAAVLPPEEVSQELERFLEPRPGLAWTDPAQWHLTLTFCPDVDEWRIDDLSDRLGAVARKHEPFRIRLAGAGAFPSVDRAKVLWAGVEHLAAAPTDSGSRETPLHALAAGARSAANAAGCVPDGARFHPHLTLARLRGRSDATAWLRVLDTFTSSDWTVSEIALVDSFLGEGPGGRARHEVVDRLPLGESDTRWWSPSG